MNFARLIRISIAAAAAVALPVGGAVLFSAATASAAGAIICTKASGTDTTTVTLKSCTPTNTTDGKGKTAASTLATGGTVKWKNGARTILGPPVLGTGTNCPAGTATDETLRGKVEGDTTGSAPVGGPYSAEVCVSSTGAISLPLGHPFKAN
jgi:hypothetical protein